jgi:ankyrin repeat protein
MHIIRALDFIIRRTQVPYLILVLIATTFLPFQKVNAQQTDLFSAVKTNNLTEVKRLLDAGGNPNAVDDDSDNVLINAAMYASAACMNLLLQKKADPNQKNKFGQTALMYCTNDADKLKSLLQNGADINTKAKSGNTALLIACVGNDPYNIVTLLLNNKADPLATNAIRETALMRAAQFGDTMTIQLLLSEGINVNAQDSYGGTALRNAIVNSNVSAVLCLLNNGANPNIVDSFGVSGLAYSVLSNDAVITKKVLKETTKVNTIDVIGMSPLMWAVYNESDRPEIIELLLDRGADINAKSKDGSTALLWAMKKGNTATVALLKRRGAQ